MKKALVVIGTFLIAVIIGVTIFFTLTPGGKSIINKWEYSLEKTDEKTYENQKKVEDTCRSMIASYTQDKLVYEQYKGSTVDEERSWANNAKIRANNTAAIYNNYVLKNRYVWRNNVPSDIYMELAYLE